MYINLKMELLNPGFMLSIQLYTLYHIVGFGLEILLHVGIVNNYLIVFFLFTSNSFVRSLKSL